MLFSPNLLLLVLCYPGLLSRGDAGIFMRFPPPTYRGAP